MEDPTMTQAGQSLVSEHETIFWESMQSKFRCIPDAYTFMANHGKACQSQDKQNQDEKTTTWVSRTSFLRTAETEFGLDESYAKLVFDTIALQDGNSFCKFGTKPKKVLSACFDPETTKGCNSWSAYHVTSLFWRTPCLCKQRKLLAHTDN